MKRVLIISSTPIKNGNSELLCKAFAKGAEAAGHKVETVHLREKQINFCRGCEACVKTGKGCVQQDDMKALIAKMHETDVFVLATPIYFMTVSAQLKVFIDRFIAGEQFVRQSECKKAYFLTACAAPADRAEDNCMAANESFWGFLKCLRKVEEGGILNACGAYAPGSVTEEWLDKAQKMGYGRLLSPARAEDARALCGTRRECGPGAYAGGSPDTIQRGPPGSVQAL